jgi:hypothetical protein
MQSLPDARKAPFAMFAFNQPIDRRKQFHAEGRFETIYSLRSPVQHVAEVSRSLLL